MTEEIKNEENKEPKIDINDYQDLEGLSTKKLVFGLWVIKHRDLFKKILTISLIVVSAVSWSYTLYGFAYYIFKGMKQDNQLIADMVNTNIIDHSYLESIAPKNLKFSNIISLKNEDKYDFYVKVENPSDRYRAEFSYCFLNRDQEVDCGNNFIFPGEIKYLISLAKEISGSSNNIGLTINSLSWSRINLHKYPDWKSFRDSRMNIKFSNIDFKTAADSGLSEKLYLNSLNFDAINDTPYNYWEVDLNIFLYLNGQIIGVNKYQIPNFYSGENRNISMNWQGKYSQVSSVSIIPEINIVDPAVYMEHRSN